MIIDMGHIVWFLTFFILLQGDVSFKLIANDEQVKINKDVPLSLNDDKFETNNNFQSLVRKRTWDYLKKHKVKCNFSFCHLCPLDSKMKAFLFIVSCCNLGYLILIFKLIEPCLMSFREHCEV